MRTTYTVKFGTVVAKGNVVCYFEVFADVEDEENSVHINQPSERFPSKHFHFGLSLASEDVRGNLA